MTATDWTAIGTCVLAAGVIIGGLTFITRKFLVRRKKRKWGERAVNVFLSIGIDKIIEARFPGLLKDLGVTPQEGNHETIRPKSETKI